jgi:hypothetical protein
MAEEVLMRQARALALRSGHSLEDAIEAVSETEAGRQLRDLANVHMMTPERAHPGTRVRVMDHHRIEERRGLTGEVVAVYGGEEYVAVDVRLADGGCRLFWPRDLEEVSPAQAWWRLLLGGDAGV